MPTQIDYGVDDLAVSQENKCGLQRKQIDNILYESSKRSRLEQESCEPNVSENSSARYISQFYDYLSTASQEMPSFKVDPYGTFHLVGKLNDSPLLECAKSLFNKIVDCQKYDI